MSIWRPQPVQPPFQPQPQRWPVPATASPLAAGTASLVYSGPSVIALTAAAATGGNGGNTYQWQRSLTSGSGYSNLTDGGGVSGSGTLNLTDGSVSSSILYYYRVVVTDQTSQTANSNEVAAQVYTGGAIGSGGGIFNSDQNGGFSG